MDNLPKLPHAVAHILLGDDSEDVFTADQMQSYARAAVEAEQEACARLCEEHAGSLGLFSVERAEVRDIREMIRARGKS